MQDALPWSLPDIFCSSGMTQSPAQATQAPVLSRFYYIHAGQPAPVYTLTKHDTEWDMQREWDRRSSREGNIKEYSVYTPLR